MAVADQELIVGDRVSRPADLAGILGVHTGTVVEVYQSAADGIGRAFPLYAIKWDGRATPNRGYLRQGLTKIEGVRRET